MGKSGFADNLSHPLIQVRGAFVSHIYNMPGEYNRNGSVKMMMKETMVAVKAAREAGKILMARFGKRLEIRDKGRDGFRNLVTQADMDSEKRIISILKTEFPGYGILSEESPEEKSDSGFRWIIDPLDGTNNFAYGIPLFGVSIALEREGELALGVINLPYYGHMLVAERGKGALLNGERIGVSGRGLREAMVMFGGDSDNPDKGETAGVMRRLEESVFNVRRLGAAVVHHSYVAAGIADAYVDLGNRPWDNAAGFIIVEEAGGRATDLSGKPWCGNNTRLITSNGKLHEGILRIVNQ